jgi:UV DNA damage endonuclease
MRETIANNLECLGKILKFNAKGNLLFFRMSSDIVPFASHPVCKFRWQKEFGEKFREIGEFIGENDFRISMHPDQFVLLNSPREDVNERSVLELEYHCEVLEEMKLGRDAKIQIHVGGAYGDKESALNRFCEGYEKLRDGIKKRLVIENDDKLYSLKDCLAIHEKTGIPVLFDSFHHECLNSGETLRSAIKSASKTWEEEDGRLMCDYSSQRIGERRGAHTEHIDLPHFRKFLGATKGTPFDLMLEIKDKEKSAALAIEEAKKLKLL